MEPLRVKDIVHAIRGKMLEGNPESRITGICIDSRNACPGDLFFALKGERSDGHFFIKNAVKNGASGVVIKRKSALSGASFVKDFTVLHTDDTRRALSQLARFYRRSLKNLNVVAVTGSNGKTTTKGMIGSVLKRRFNCIVSPGNYNNDLGVSLSLFQATKGTDFEVMEFAANHPGEIAYLCDVARPDLGIITGIGLAHVGYFGGLDKIRKAKLEIFRYRNTSSVINGDDEFLRERAPRRSITFGWKENNHIRGFNFYNDWKRLRCSFSVREKGAKAVRVRLRTPFFFNAANALAAVAALRLLGVGLRTAAGVLEGFSFPENRGEFFSWSGRKVLSDGYNANPSSVAALWSEIRHMEVRGRIVFVFGDMLELGRFSRYWHRKICAMLKEDEKLLLLTVGPASSGAAIDVFPSQRRFHAGSVPEILNILHRISRRGDLVVLKASHRIGLEKLAAKLRRR